MKSIRRRLLLWFLAGLGMTWLIGGFGTYYSYRAGLLAGIETELLSLARQVRVNQKRGSGGGMGRGNPQHQGDPTAEFGPDIFWQVWLEEGGEVTSSDNLDVDLPRLDPKHGESLVRTVTLKNGASVMVAGGRFGMGDRGVEVSVAKNLAGVRRKLLGMLLGIALSGLAVAAVAVLWVFFVVRDGLAPLLRIANQVDAIDVGSLGGRFETDQVPSELHPIVSRLNQLMTRLESSFTRERRFSSDLAHEMRTPVAELRMLAESAVKWPDAGGRQAWDEVLGSVDRMEMVVQAMLQLARLEQATQEQIRTSLALTSMVEESWAAQDTRAAARGITLRPDIKPDATVSGNSALWHHLLSNVLGNAADYADEGSEVVVFTEKATVGRDPIVCVANAASQLAPEDIDLLFDRFWRGDAARSGSSHCGLGLPLARACAESMNWRVHAHQRPRDGWLEIRIESAEESE